METGNAGSALWFANQTVIHPVGLAATIALGILIFALPRAYALLPILLAACLIAPAQRIAIADCDFTPARILVLCGICRIVLRGELRAVRWHSLDTFVLLSSVVETMVFVMQRDFSKSLVYRAGMTLDTAATYLLLRALITDVRDVRRGTCVIAAVAIPVAIAFLFEASSGRNIFSVFGGVPEVTLVREGRLRCQGAFSHPILAGCFWASLLPLMVAGMWGGATTKSWCIAGIVAAFVVIVTCSSSTPIAGVIAAVVAACAFGVRRRMRVVRWGILLTLVVLHLVMQKPVWHLLARLDLAGGSTGWHRFFLVDQCIRRFPEWALIGTRSTVHWGHGLGDVTNQYVLQAINGGFLTLVLFVATIVVAFRTIGQILRAAQGEPGMTALAWALGTAVLVHVVNFFGVSYFGQIVMIWYLPLAMIASLGSRLSPASDSLAAQMTAQERDVSPWAGPAFGGVVTSR